MGKPTDRLGQPTKRIYIVTFSGPHGAGKTTMMNDFRNVVAMTKQATADHVLPSISTLWQAAESKERLAQGLEPLVRYDDINRLGLRQKMQQELPKFLSTHLMQLVSDAFNHGDGPNVVILADRWFGDIAAYTELEREKLEDVAAVETALETEYAQTLDALQALANDNNVAIFMTHVYVPAAACLHFQFVDLHEKANRPTDISPAAWEAAYVSHGSRFVSNDRRLTIQQGDRVQRVAEIWNRTIGFAG